MRHPMSHALDTPAGPFPRPEGMPSVPPVVFELLLPGCYRGVGDRRSASPGTTALLKAPELAAMRNAVNRARDQKAVTRKVAAAELATIDKARELLGRGYDAVAVKIADKPVRLFEEQAKAKRAKRKRQRNARRAGRRRR